MTREQKREVGLVVLGIVTSPVVLAVWIYLLFQGIGEEVLEWFEQKGRS